jgi:hypothetical protein
VGGGQVNHCVGSKWSKSGRRGEVCLVVAAHHAVREASSNPTTCLKIEHRFKIQAWLAHRFWLLLLFPKRVSFTSTMMMMMMMV